MQSGRPNPASAVLPHTLPLEVKTTHSSNEKHSLLSLPPLLFGGRMLPENETGPIRVQLGDLELDVNLGCDGVKSYTWSNSSEDKDISNEQREDNNDKKSQNDVRLETAAPLLLQKFMDVPSSEEENSMDCEEYIDEPLLLDRSNKRHSPRAFLPGLRFFQKRNMRSPRNREIPHAALSDDCTDHAVYVPPILEKTEGNIIPLSITQHDATRTDKNTPSKTLDHPKFEGVDKISSTSKAPHSGQGDKNTSSKAAYDMSFCTEKAPKEESPLIEEIEDQEPLLPAKKTHLRCFCGTNSRRSYTTPSRQSPRQTPRLSPSSREVSSPSSSKQKSFFGVGRGYKGIEHETVEMLGTPVTQRDASPPSFYTSLASSSHSSHHRMPMLMDAHFSKPFTNSPPVFFQTEVRVGRSEARAKLAASPPMDREDHLESRTNPTTLSYDDLQERFRRELDLHNELDEVVQQAGINDNTLDTLRAPLDIQLSTLYEAEDEDEVAASVDSRDTPRENVGMKIEPKTELLGVFLGQHGHSSDGLQCDSTIENSISVWEDPRIVDSSGNAEGGNVHPCAEETIFPEVATPNNEMTYNEQNECDEQECTMAIESSQINAERSTIDPPEVPVEDMSPKAGQSLSEEVLISPNPIFPSLKEEVQAHPAMLIAPPPPPPPPPIPSPREGKNTESLRLHYEQGDDIIIRCGSGDISELTDEDSTVASLYGALMARFIASERAAKSLLEPLQAVPESRDDTNENSLHTAQIATESEHSTRHAQRESRTIPGQPSWIPESNGSYDIPDGNNYHDECRDQANEDEDEFWCQHYLESDSTCNPGRRLVKVPIKQSISTGHSPSRSSSRSRRLGFSLDESEDPYADLYYVTRITI